MSSQQFVTELRRLRAIYEGTYKGLEAKYMLSYYLNVPFRPNNRHAVTRRLQRTPWAPHLHALAEAIRAGERFYLLGEDLNADPLTGMTIDPLAPGDPGAFVDRLARMPGAKTRTLATDGMNFRIVGLGKGALVTGDASVDRAAYHSSDFVAWHERLKRNLQRAAR
jgi:hypothetical protein